MADGLCNIRGGSVLGMAVGKVVAWRVVGSGLETDAQLGAELAEPQRARHSA